MQEKKIPYSVVKLTDETWDCTGGRKDFAFGNAKLHSIVATEISLTLQVQGGVNLPFGG